MFYRRKFTIALFSSAVSEIVARNLFAISKIKRSRDIFASNVLIHAVSNKQIQFSVHPGLYYRIRCTSHSVSHQLNIQPRRLFN